MFRATCSVTCLLFITPFVCSDEPDFDAAPVVREFLGKYCLDCHNTDSAEGERDFESLQFPLSTQEHLILADEIIDQVTLKEMPPPDNEQPTDNERLTVLNTLRKSIVLSRERFSGTGGRTVMRRLSLREPFRAF